jgi:hypothetical protein
VPAGFAKLAVKLRVTGVPAPDEPLLLRLAVSEQVPALRSITRLSEFSQTAGVIDFTLTGAPELACAAIGNGEIPKILLGIESELNCLRGARGDGGETYRQHRQAAPSRFVEGQFCEHRNTSSSAFFGYGQGTGQRLYSHERCLKRTPA